MADDDIERLLREVDAMNSGPTPKTDRPSDLARRRSGDVAPTERGRAAAAARTGVIAGAVSGVGVFLGTAALSWLPLIDNPISSGMGAFVGAFVTGAVLRLRK